MPIAVEDLKLLKPAVMADTTDGGGAMTGTEIVDGQSNNMFPDTSDLDRANGRVQLRKPFGVAHSDDTATLLGAHVILTDAPDDPLVNVAIFAAGSWAETREKAKERIERYVVKGPRVPARLYDTHYAGTLQLRLISFVPTQFPGGGEAIVLVSPDGDEQYVRILRTALSTQQLAVSEGGAVVVLTAFMCTADIGQELKYDFVGPPAQRLVNEADYAQVLSTSPSVGAKFYGIKTLREDAESGELQVTVDGGIYTALVPAATTETPMIDQFPLRDRAALMFTASDDITLPSVDMQFAPNKVIYLPTPIEPNSVAITHGAASFVDDGAGNLKQGSLVVGAVDYKAKTITFLAGSPDYGTSASSINYRPATVAGASAYSARLVITDANQGLSFTSIFEPAPAPGTFALNYMAQGRWYVLTDDANGKLSGADSSYGVGSINYATGSMSVTLGAIPDVGSALVSQWGDKSSAVAVSSGNLPAKLAMNIPMPSRTKAQGIVVAWSRGATNYTATTNADGILVGAATGKFLNDVLSFEPAVFPDDNITVTSKRAPTAATAISTTGSNTYLLTGSLPVAPGTFRATTLVSYPSNVRWKPNPLPVFDINGIVYLRYSGNAEDYAANNGGLVPCGTIDYSTGVVVMDATPEVFAWVKRETVPSGAWVVEAYRDMALVSVTMGLVGALTNVGYAAGAPADDVVTMAPGPWVASIFTNGPLLLVDGTMLKIGSDLYTALAATLRKGWSILTGSAPGGAAGTVSSGGTITVTSIPSDFANSITWFNVAQDTSAKEVYSGVFRSASAPLKPGVFQLKEGSHVGSANDAGVISGDGFSGQVDYQRGLISWVSTVPIDPASLSYNGVFLQYLPIDAGLLGIETARLPLDGRVPIFRSGDICIVHNTEEFAFPNPLVKTTVYDMGRVRIASVKVTDALGVTVPSTKYQTDLDAGTIWVPTSADIAAYVQPFKVAHRIEDMVKCNSADLSGVLKFDSRLTHDFPADNSYVSSALVFGDVFARAYGFFEQNTWLNQWEDEPSGSPISANFNETLFPPVVTNRGAIKERWALVFTNTNQGNIIGETVGVIGTFNTGADLSPMNPSVGVPYWHIDKSAFGLGWQTGNVVRFDTDACGSPFWTARTTLLGPATVTSDKFTVALRGNVDRP